jgi:hypothetical protein
MQSFLKIFYFFFRQSRWRKLLINKKRNLLVIGCWRSVHLNVADIKKGEMFFEVNDGTGECFLPFGILYLMLVTSGSHWGVDWLQWRMAL